MFCSNTRKWPSAIMWLFLSVKLNKLVKLSNIRTMMYRHYTAWRDSTHFSENTTMMERNTQTHTWSSKTSSDDITHRQREPEVQLFPQHYTGPPHSQSLDTPLLCTGDRNSLRLAPCSAAHLHKHKSLDFPTSVSWK